MSHNDLNTVLTFPRFSELPAEIRIKIWRIASTPRVVRLPLGIKALATPKRQRRPGYHLPLSIQQTSPPALLTVNREARYEVLPFYQSFNPADATRFFYRCGLDRGPILDPNIDIIYLEAFSCVTPNRFRIPSMVNCIRHVAVFDDSHGPTNIDEVFEKFLDILLQCPNLDNLCLCLPDPPNWYGSSMRIRAAQRRDELDALLRKKWFDKFRQITATPSTTHVTTEGWIFFNENGKKWEKVVQVAFMSELRDGIIRRREPISVPDPMLPIKYETKSPNILES